MTAEDREVAEGVRALRASLKESQQQFSNRLGVSISTIARYELQNPPQGNMLKRLAELAIQAGREDLSIIFEKALLEASDPRSPIAEAIRSLRIDLGDTQQEFAHRTGLSVVSIARYETNALPKKAVLTRLIKIAEDAGRNDLQSIFQRASSAEPAEPEIDESIQFVLQQMGTTEGNDFLRRISPQRLKRIRKLLSREFQSEGELSAMCAAAWLLDHYSYSPERDTILVEEIRRVLDKRTLPLTQAELEMLGELGRRALRAKVLTLPLSQAIKKLRDHLDISPELLANGLNTSPTVIEEFEAGTRIPGKNDLEQMLWLVRKTRHKLPELDLAFTLALETAVQREHAAEREDPDDLKDDSNE